VPAKLVMNLNKTGVTAFVTPVLFVYMEIYLIVHLIIFNIVNTMKNNILNVKLLFNPFFLGLGLGKIKLILLFLFFYSSLKSQDNPATVYIQYVSVDHMEPNIVYAATNGQGLFKSTDYGESWVLKCDAAQNKSFYVVLPDPKDSKRVFAGGLRSGVLLSTDKGETWKSIGLPDITINDIAIDKNNPNRLFILASEGIYSNQNIEKEAWVLCFDRNKFVRETLNLPLTNLRESPNQTTPARSDTPDSTTQRPGGFRGGYGRFSMIGLSPFHPNTIVVGAGREGGFFRSDDGGKTWKHETISGIYRRVDVVYFHQSDPHIFYLATHHQGVFKTFNFGKSWVPLSDGLEPQIRSPHYGVYLISGFAVDKNDPNIFYTGSDYSNWKTTDGGENWFEFDKTLTCQFVRGMAVDPVNSNIVYAGSNVGMYKSINAGKSWYSINVGFQERQIKKQIKVQSADGEIHFALTEGHPFVFRKVKNERWTSAGWLLDDYRVKTGQDLYFDDSKQELVVVTDTGHFVSKDFGFRWTDKRVKFADAKSMVKELKPDNPNFTDNYVATINLTGDVFFDDSLVDEMYRKPPYISLQVIETGYPYNGTVPVWSMNIDDCLKSTVEIPKSTIDLNKKYYLYAEVRDFQKNYKTAFSTIAFKNNRIILVEMNLQEGFCLKKNK